MKSELCALKGLSGSQLQGFLRTLMNWIKSGFGLGKGTLTTWIQPHDGTEPFFFLAAAALR